MENAASQALPGGEARRDLPTGLQAGAPLSRLGRAARVFELVASELVEAERVLGELLVSDVAAVPAVSGYLVASGGKRIRPALTALGARTVGFSRPVERLMCVGELLHLGSLLHDDVVDDAVQRRGQPAAHVTYGNAVTILTGDFCLARAVWLAAEEGGHRVVTELGRTVTEMAEGEVLQLQRAGDLGGGLEPYLDVVNRKSAALISWCVAAPAWALGHEEHAEALVRFGRRVGVAFQITDDVLDYRGGAGKRVGTDLRERKMTLPLLYAFERDEDLRSLLLDGSPSSESLSELVERVVATGALERASAFARDLVDDGIAALGCLPPTEGRRALEALGRYLVDRVV